jgi:hypothetical protein
MPPPFPAIALTLGMPRLPEDWSNDQVLGFFRVMWDQWLLKSRQGSGPRVDESIRGPAPPAVVAAAAKIAFASLGHASTVGLFRTEPHQRPLAERAPVEPAGTAMLERSDSGTFRVPLFTVSSEIGISDFVDGESKAAAISNSTPAPPMAMVRCSLIDPRRRNRNLQWLRLHFRALGDVGRLPFNNADLWQLHQYFFSPPIEADNQYSDQSISSLHSDPLRNNVDVELSRSIVSQGQSNSGVSTIMGSMQMNNHKRRPENAPSDASAHVAKRPKNLQPRIAYYPRIMVSRFYIFDVSHFVVPRLTIIFPSCSQNFNILEQGQHRTHCHYCVNLNTPKEQYLQIETRIQETYLSNLTYSIMLISI